MQYGSNSCDFFVKTVFVICNTLLKQIYLQDCGYSVKIKTDDKLISKKMAEATTTANNDEGAFNDVADLSEAYSSSYQRITMERFTSVISNYSHIFAVSGCGKACDTQQRLLNLLKDYEQIKDQLCNENDANNHGKNIIIFDNEDHNNMSYEKVFESICKRMNCVTFWIELQNTCLMLRRVYNPFFYIKRQFKYIESVEIAKTTILHALKYDQRKIGFVFSCVANRDVLIKMFKCSRSAMDNWIEASEATLIQDGDGSEAFRNSCKMFDQAHWVELQDQNIFIWRRSHGSMDIIRQSKHDVKICNDEEEFIDKTKGSLVILSDDAGAGKSTTLKIISRRLRTSPQKIILINFEDDAVRNSFNMFRSKNQITMENISEFICHFGTVKLSKDCLLENDIKVELVFILDGLNGMLTENLCTVRDFLTVIMSNVTCTIYIAVCPQSTTFLEDQLSVLATKFTEITKDDQRIYLIDHWYNNLSLLTENNLYKHELSTVTQYVLENLPDLFKDYFSNKPLDLKLISDLCLSYVKQFLSSKKGRNDFLKLDINALLECLIQTKYEVLYLKEKALDISPDSVGGKAMIERLREIHSKLAFKCIFPTYCNQNTHILEPITNISQVAGNSTLITPQHKFVHSIFCDYYCACFLVKCLQKVQGYSEYHLLITEVAEKELFMDVERDPYKKLKFFMNSMLTTELPLHKAIFNKDFDAFEELMKDNPSKQHDVDALGRSALHYAAQFGNGKIISTLLTSDLDCFQVDMTGRTPLHYAIRYGRFDNVKNLCIADNTDAASVQQSSTTISKLINMNDISGCSSLYYAGDSQNRSMLVWFITHGADISALRDINIKLNCFFILTGLGLTNDVLQLLNNNPELLLNIEEEGLKNLLCFAFDYHSVELIMCVFQYCLQEMLFCVWNYNYSFYNYIHVSYIDCMRHASDAEHLTIIRHLFKNNLDYGVKYSYDCINVSYYLSCAATAGHLETLKYVTKFINDFVTLNSTKSNSQPSCDWVEETSYYKHIESAIKYGHRNIVQFIWEECRHLITNDSGNTPLILAVCHRKIDLVKYLCENDASLVNTGNKEGKMPLHFAAEERQLDIMKYLVGYGADVNVTDSTDSTALDYARRNNLYEISIPLEEEMSCIKYLVLDCHASSNEFKHFDNDDLKQILTVTKDTVNILVNGTSSVLHKAVEIENEIIVRYLLSIGADPNIKDANNKTPLECLKEPSIISYVLFQHGARFNSSTEHYLSTPQCYHCDKQKKAINNNRLITSDDILIDKYGIGPGDNSDYQCYKCRLSTSETKKCLKTSKKSNHPIHLFRRDNNYEDDSNFTAVDYAKCPMPYLINAIDDKGQTLMHRAAELNDIIVLNALFKLDKYFEIKRNTHYDLRGYERLNIISLQDDAGNSPLHVAARGNHLNIVKLLLQNGASYDIVNNNGETPAQCCTSSAVAEIFKKFSKDS